ncbi:MAG: tRNA lysidine(34) synthetase TilS [Planctomycetota bacterium]
MEPAPAPNDDPRVTRRVLRVLTESLRRDAGVAEGDGVLVACSGGADSVALLRAMHALAPKRRWRLRVEALHVQHHLRASAEADARFVASLCETLGIHHHRIDVGETDHQREASRNLEMQARQWRLKAYREIAEARGLRFVATGHHAGDQLETVLMRLMRGAGVSAMAGIAPARPLGPGVDLLHPLLRLHPETLRAYLRSLNQAWREDETNADTTRMRSALRSRVTPELFQLAPDLPERLAAWQSHANGVGEVMREASETVSFPLERAAARSLNPAVFQHAIGLRLAELGEHGDRIPRSLLESIRHAAIETSGKPRRFELAQSMVFVDHDIIRIETRDSKSSNGA